MDNLNAPGPPNVHRVDRLAVSAVLATVDADGPVRLSYRVSEFANATALFRRMCQDLEVNYYGPDVDWETIAPNLDGMLDVLRDLDFAHNEPDGTARRTRASRDGLIVTLWDRRPGEDPKVPIFVEVWLSAAEFWNPRGLPFHLLLEPLPGETSV
jgi:hypothetical protein